MNCAVATSRCLSDVALSIARGDTISPLPRQLPDFQPMFLKLKTKPGQHTQWLTSTDRMASWKLNFREHLALLYGAAASHVIFRRPGFTASLDDTVYTSTTVHVEMDLRLATILNDTVTLKQDKVGRDSFGLGGVGSVAHRPVIGRWAGRWINHWVCCDASPVPRQTYIHLASQPQSWYQIIYCSVTEANGCERIAQSYYLEVERLGVELATFRSRVATTNTAITNIQKTTTSRRKAFSCTNWTGDCNMIDRTTLYPGFRKPRFF